MILFQTYLPAGSAHDLSAKCRRCEQSTNARNSGNISVLFASEDDSRCATVSDSSPPLSSLTRDINKSAKSAAGSVENMRLVRSPELRVYRGTSSGIPVDPFPGHTPTPKQNPSGLSVIVHVVKGTAH